MAALFCARSHGCHPHEFNVAYGHMRCTKLGAKEDALDDEPAVACLRLARAGFLTMLIYNSN